MKLWDKLKTVFQPKNFNTVNYREMSLFASTNPNSPSTFELSQQELLSLSYFTKGVQIIAQDIAKTTWVVQKLDAKGNWVNYDFSKLHFLLNRSPSKYLSAFEFKKIIVWNLFLYGKAPIYVHYEKQEDGKYRLLDLIPIYPNWCFKEWNADENKFEYKIFTRQLGMSEHDINVEEPIIVQADDFRQNFIHVFLRAIRSSFQTEVWKYDHRYCFNSRPFGKERRWLWLNYCSDSA